MKELTVFTKGHVDFFQQFFWVYQHQQGTDVFSRLVAIDFDGKMVTPLYLPLFTFLRQDTQLTIWINLSRWESIVLVLSPNGVKTKYIDFRNEDK